MQYLKFLGQFQQTESKLVLYQNADQKRVGPEYFALNKNIPNWIQLNSQRTSHTVFKRQLT